jgi:glutaconate CoA-transferase subunit B
MPEGAPAYSADEMMTVAAARMIEPGAVVFVGIGLPSAAANLARRTHAPDAVHIYESGAIGAKPTVLPLSIGDGELAETADLVVSVPEMFAYWLQGGRIDLGFLGAAQIDRFANINTTVVGGTYAQPAVRLPGAGGAPEIAASCKRVLITLRHSARALVDRLDFVTSVGHGNGPGARQRLGLPGNGPSAVVTDLGVLTPHSVTRELTLTSVHPGVDADAVCKATGWALRVAPSVATSAPPTAEELAVLRALKASTARRPST